MGAGRVKFAYAPTVKLRFVVVFGEAPPPSLYDNCHVCVESVLSNPGGAYWIVVKPEVFWIVGVTVAPSNLTWTEALFSATEPSWMVALTTGSAPTFTALFAGLSEVS